MIWKKLKKAIIPLMIVKLIIFVFFIFFGDAISISRDVSYSNNYNKGFENDSIAFKEQRFIRIVRNEGERGIIIKIKGRKNATPFKEEDREINIPIVD